VTSETVANPPVDMPRILPHLIYDDVGAAIEFLTNAFGFRERTWARHMAPDGVIGRTQMAVKDSVIGPSPNTSAASRQKDDHLHASAHA
jgi:uncharacterized glyoxalase superfamily protein PhnB